MRWGGAVLIRRRPLLPSTGGDRRCLRSRRRGASRPRSLRPVSRRVGRVMGLVTQRRARSRFRAPNAAGGRVYGADEDGELLAGR